MEFLDLFFTALMPVLKVLLVTAVGLFLATERVNLLGENARQQLNGLVFYVFFPALIGASLADTITLESMVTLWFMPVNILLTFVIGSALAWILVKVTGTPQHLQGLVIGCSSAGNLGNMLLIILPVICQENKSPFGDSSTCSTHGEAYASLSLAIQAIYVWSYVYFIMRTSAEKGIKEINTSDSTSIINTSYGTSQIFSEISTEALLPSNDHPSSEDHSDQVELPHTRFEGKMKVLLDSVKQHLEMFSEKINLKMVFAPSTIAAIVGLVIGIISPMRKVMIGDSAPLRVIYSSAELLGEAAIPSVTLIVGANLLKGLRGPGVSPSLIAGILTIRNIILPAMGIGVVKAARHFGLVGTYTFYQFTLMLQYAIPSAVNIGTITQMIGSGGSEFSVIMLWSYAVATVSLTLWLTLYMWLLT
ncbi:hypothetical protein Ddye_018398 [Dipteronia dyeriana]|uniref:PIN-like protein n=1 Tax=Dipteronia dyeriana TaxID=168575 RepID=A0AAD9X0S5_9ROSI|nr:hypothetical protein Ddye_018398 [Dipteronia dyeriana]